MTDRDHAITVAAPDALAAPSRLHPMVEAAIQAGATPDQLREFLALQREHEAHEAMRAYQRAMVALKAALPTVLARDTLVDFATAKGRTTYRHTSLAAAVDAVTPVLTEHGFSASWVPGTTDRGGVTVECRLTHCAGHTETASLVAPVDTSGSKSPAQGVASTITLLSRYTLLSLLGIATADHAEPSGPPAERVDANRTLRAVARLKKLGLSREAAEEHLGRDVSAWTGADLERLAAWVQGQTEKAE